MITEIPQTPSSATEGQEPAATVAKAPLAETSPAEAVESAPAPGAASSSPEDEMSFAEMLAEHEQAERGQTRLEPGQRVTVRIVAITGDTVFVSTGSKVDGIVDREELLVDGELPHAVNDLVELYVVSVSSQEVKLSKIVRGAGSIAVLEEARDASLPVEGKVTATIKGGYAVEIMKRRAFCPLSQIDLHPLADPESVVGKTFPFIITRLEKGGRNIVVSRRALLEQEQAAALEKVLETLNVGDVLEATVTRLAQFGAFVELAPGVEGLVHLSELSWARVAQADEVVSAGDRIRVKILAIDRTDKGVRFSLSSRAVTEDPWKNVSERLSEGETVTGKVIRTAPFGAFVEVLPGIEGLVHLSEFSYEKRVNKAEDVVAAGDMVSVKIKEIDPAQKRISLSMRDVAGDPWSQAAELFTVDSEVVGTVARRAAFGLFIDLAPGITGLMPTSVAQAAKNKAEIAKLGAGDPISVIIRQIDLPQRRISLAPVGSESVEAQAEEKNWKQHVAKPERPSVGSLGLALQAALKNKK